MSRTEESTRINIRVAEPDDLPALQDIFVETVSHTCNKDYNPRQIKVWISSVENTVRWQNMMKDQLVLVACTGGCIIGFATLDNRNYIDFFYIYSGYLRQGIASLLYDKIEAQAIHAATSELTADVSVTAKPFFEQIGFRETAVQHVLRQGVELVNYKMVKNLVNNL